MLPGPKDLAEPHKEIRFTRSAQARQFFILASAVATLAIFLGAAAFTPGLGFPLWWSTLPVLPAALLSLLAYRCIRHAYLILTPLGIEIFPFFNPRRNLQVIYWSEIDHAEISPDHRTLTIHYNAGRTAGLKATLTPIVKSRRALLTRAIEGRMAQRTEGSASPGFLTSSKSGK